LKIRQSHNKSNVSIIKSENNEVNELINSRNMQLANIKQTISIIISQNYSLFDSVRLIADFKNVIINISFMK